MKVAVSIPDPLLKEVDSLAAQLHASRSEIFSRALREFLARHAPDRLTEQMNAALLQIADQKDPFANEAARGVLKRVDW